ncbi:PH domain-containing protein [Ruminiclostridium herbifermentans]|uniref:PH domain-containing protein n=1 Tax=Ruminiclostridium herbifermentans TaxID=2488810 RepID=A0A4V6EQ26_9FIRM|nr:PH domain-containing protein [Ruminiclostridium herbifermentans]QNU68416.1 PH domain-containing protein [Ruminiclostridium herbifermentans]
MEYQKLDSRILISWRIVRLISLVIVGLILTVALIIMSRVTFLEAYLIYGYIVAGIILSYMLLGLFLYPAIEYRQWGYIISDDRVEIRHGIFLIKITVIPIVRIQHITISQGPINRRLGISTINVHTASGVFAIEGISSEEASAMAEMLKSKLYIRLENNEK